MAEIVLTTTTTQDAILERLRQKINAARAAEGLAPLADVPALVRYVLGNAVVSYREQQWAEDVTAVGGVYLDPATTAATRQAIRDAAGI